MEKEPHARPKSARALYLLLFALAWVQLSYASHQFEHVAGDLSGACVVCNQLERLDSTAFHDPATIPVTAADPVAAAGDDGAVLPVPSRCYESRAPPAT